MPFCCQCGQSVGSSDVYCAVCGTRQPSSAAPAGAVAFVAEGAAFALPVAEFVDLAAERTRLTKEIAQHASDIEHSNRKLGNVDFVSRAPPEVIEESRERLAEAQSAKARLEGVLEKLETAG